jgi:hypothetical protein
LAPEEWARKKESAHPKTASRVDNFMILVLKLKLLDGLRCDTTL